MYYLKLDHNLLTYFVFSTDQILNQKILGQKLPNHSKIMQNNSHKNLHFLQTNTMQFWLLCHYKNGLAMKMLDTNIPKLSDLICTIEKFSKWVLKSVK